MGLFMLASLCGCGGGGGVGPSPSPISITEASVSPAATADFKGGDVTIQARVTSNAGTITSVQASIVSGSGLAEDPIELVLDTANLYKAIHTIGPNGESADKTYSISVTAKDSAGNQSAPALAGTVTVPRPLAAPPPGPAPLSIETSGK
jgi:hypothetical protein